MSEIISFTSRKQVEQARLFEEVEAQEKAFADEMAQHQARLLQILDDTRRLVVEGKLEGLIVVGRDPSTRYFYTQIDLDIPGTSLNDVYPFIGLLESLKLEMADSAMMAPAMMADGRYVAPVQEQGE